LCHDFLFNIISTSEVIQGQINWEMNDAYMKMWKERAMAYVKTLFQNSSGDEENHEKPQSR